MKRRDRIYFTRKIISRRGYTNAALTMAETFSLNIATPPEKPTNYPLWQMN